MEAVYADEVFIEQWVLSLPEAPGFRLSLDTAEGQVSDVVQEKRGRARVN